MTCCSVLWQSLSSMKQMVRQRQTMTAVHWCSSASHINYYLALMSCWVSSMHPPLAPTQHRRLLLLNMTSSRSVSQSVCHLSLLHEVCVTGDHELCICRVFFCAAEMWRSDVMMFHELAKQLQNQLKFYYTLQPHYNTFGIWNRLTKLMFIILFWLSAVCLNSEQN